MHHIRKLNGFIFPIKKKIATKMVEDRTCEMRRPTVTASWLTVPKPPRNVSGEISEMYIGTRDVFRPVVKSSLNVVKRR